MTGRSGTTVPVPAPADRWEAGSEFDWSDRWAPGSPASGPGPTTGPAIGRGPCEWFSTGRAALLGVLGLLRTAWDAEPVRRAGRRLHLPSFFCMDVAAALSAACDLAWYRDLPDAPGPDFGTLRAGPGDVVLAVNLFGTRDGLEWQRWTADHPDVAVVEDHTHDPFSPWSRRGTGHYAVASLRKTLPLPDGAVVWSPRGLGLPRPPAAPGPAADRKLAGMILKGMYLRGAVGSKDAYRPLLVESELALGRESGSAASAFARWASAGLDVAALRARREANVTRFLAAVAAVPAAPWRPLFRSWPAGGMPFNGVLACTSGAVRDALRAGLIEQSVYAAVHWPQDGEAVTSGDPQAADLSRRVLTIPMDHRYSAADVDRIVDRLAAAARRLSDGRRYGPPPGA